MTIHLRVGTLGDDDGHDTLHPRLLGTSLLDYIYDDAGNDYISSGNDTDFLRGSFGNDEIHAGNGADYADGGENNDRVFGDAGSDILLGLSGNDTVNGGDGNDTISGGLGADVLIGESGTDKFAFISPQDSPAPAHDQITDVSLSSGDVIDLSSIHAFSSDAFIGTVAFSAQWQVRQGTANGHATVEVNTSGTSGAEMVIDLNGKGTLTENDFILSGGVTTDDAKHSVRLGTTGPDTLSSGGGEDYVFGNAGYDKLAGNADSDVVRGGDGTDRVDGGAGDDALYGGAGNDTFVFSRGRDIVQDYESGKDHIEVTSASVHSFSQLGISGDASGSTVVVADLGSIFLADTAPSHLHASDFVFK